MGIFSFGKSKGEKPENPANSAGQYINYFQVVGVRNAFCEKLFLCVGLPNGVMPFKLSDITPTSYSWEPVDQVRESIRGFLSEREKMMEGTIYESGKIDSLSDAQIKLKFPNLDKEMIERSLEQYLEDYIRITEMTRRRVIENESVTKELSLEFGYDVWYSFKWRSRLGRKG